MVLKYIPYGSLHSLKYQHTSIEHFQKHISPIRGEIFVFLEHSLVGDESVCSLFLRATIGVKSAQNLKPRLHSCTHAFYLSNVFNKCCRNSYNYIDLCPVDGFIAGLHVKQHHVAEDQKIPYVDYLQKIMRYIMQESVDKNIYYLQIHRTFWQ